MGTAVGGTAAFRIAVPDGADGLLYLQADELTLDAAPHDFPMTQAGDGAWYGGYTIPEALASQEVHEIATHSVYGSLTCYYAVEVLNVADAFNQPSGRRYP